MQSTTIPAVVNTIAEASSYAQHGWHVLQLRARSKKPVHVDWPKLATTDPDVIAGWLEQHPDMNIGVLLGPKSGIVDIEYDGAEGEATANRIFAMPAQRLDSCDTDGCYTPTFRSARSTHRLFRWSDAMPDVPGKINWQGLELRLGSRTAGIQSVFPPSVHESGVTYQWLPGLSPDDVDVQPLPAEIWAAIQGAVEPHATHRDPHSDDATIAEGHRNSTLFAEACNLWRRHIGSDDADAVVQERLAATNNERCSPPLPMREVVTICASARRAVESQSPDERATVGKLSSLGLTYVDGEWQPGRWSVRVILSEPPQFLLHIPACDDPVPLTAGQYDRPDKVHLAVLAASGGAICLSDRPRRWASIWTGISTPKRSTIGLKAKLLAAAERVAPADELRPGAALAAAVAMILDKASTIEDPTSRKMMWRDSDGRILFAFGQLLKQLQLERVEVTRVELSKFLRDYCGAEQRVIRLADKLAKRMILDVKSWTRLGDPS